MALIKCPECGKEISDRAAACIHCGFPLQQAVPETKLYSIAADRKRPENLNVLTSLVELAGMPLSEATTLLTKTGGVILAHMPEPTANYYVQEFNKSGLRLRIVEETEPVTEEECELHPVVPIRKFYFPRKDLPYLEGRWRKGFPSLSDLIPGAAESGIYQLWRKTENPGIEPSAYTTVTLFDSNRVKLGSFEANRIQVNNSETSVTIVLPEAVNKRVHKPACLAVLGDVEVVPLDEYSRTGDMTAKQTQSTDYLITCPKCGSTSVQLMKNGFGVGKAAAGALLLGPIGLAAGAIGSNQVTRICMNCKHRF